VTTSIEMNENTSLIPTERIERAILLIRGEKVMLDTDLAVIYGVSTKALNQAVKRNITRFPADFMFQQMPFLWRVWNRPLWRRTCLPKKMGHPHYSLDRRDLHVNTNYAGPGFLF
jgi:hypothetical protein